MAWPDGKLLPRAWATGSSRNGRGRSTTILTTVSSRLPTSTVTSRNTSRRVRPARISTTEATMHTIHSQIGAPRSVTALSGPDDAGRAPHPLVQPVEAGGVDVDQPAVAPDLAHQQPEGHRHQGEGEGEERDPQPVAPGRVEPETEPFPAPGEGRHGAGGTNTSSGSSALQMSNSSDPSNVSPSRARRRGPSRDRTCMRRTQRCS